MANGGEKGNDFYAVLGLNKDCTQSELRNAYKKLALKWHPDRCSASGNSKFVEEAKKKFQAVQQAYSVLSDANKRFLYDVGVYDSDDDENGMGEFLNEMAAMMSQTEPNENGEESFEELQQLFENMFEGDIVSAESGYAAGCSASSTYMTYTGTSTTSNNIGKAEESFDFNCTYQNFCLGMEQLQDIKGKGEGGGSRSRHSRKQKNQLAPMVFADISADWRILTIVHHSWHFSKSIIMSYYKAERDLGERTREGCLLFL